MTDDDFAPFAQNLAVAAEVLDAPLSELRIRGYYEALKDLPLEAVLLALKHALRDATWLPKPADLRRTIEGESEDRAAEAWGQLLSAIRRVGTYGNPALCLPPPVMQAMRDTFGSWAEACAMSTEGPERLGYQKRFTQAYQATERREVQRQLALQAPVGVSVAGLIKGMS